MIPPFPALLSEGGLQDGDKWYLALRQYIFIGDERQDWSWRGKVVSPAVCFPTYLCGRNLSDFITARVPYTTEDGSQS